jgi:N6-adenosine-specific RNA methylase IME4
LPDGEFDVIVADPPWTYEGSPTKWGAAGKEYECMSNMDIFHLRVGDLLTERGVLFLWATCPKLDVAMDALANWGLHFRGVAFVWVKTTSVGVPIRAQGVRPSITKPLVELVLAASPVRTGRPMPLGSEAVCQTVFAPKGEHSVKPDGVQTAIETLYPNALKLEMFARRARSGWSNWGLEAPDTIR